MVTRALCVATAVAALFLSDRATSSGMGERLRLAIPGNSRGECEGARAPLSETLGYPLRWGAFPGSGRADVAVHVPPGFDATRRPGLVLYFHGWQNCVEAALSTTDVPCADEGSPRPGAALIAQVDASRVNAILVAVEVRPDALTGEPGQMAMPGGAHALLRELLSEKLAAPLGCTLDPDGLDRIVVVAHSGGYQAAAGVLEGGDLPRITEVDLLDALYGGQNIFARWIAEDPMRFDARISRRLRFVDLYTCCGGTLGSSRSMVARVGDILGPVGLAHSVRDDDGNSELDGEDLTAPVVFKRVARAHADLPRAYLRALLEAAGFARISSR
jgi:hypothetical protein